MGVRIEAPLTGGGELVYPACYRAFYRIVIAISSGLMFWVVKGCPVLSHCWKMKGHVGGGSGLCEPLGRGVSVSIKSFTVSYMLYADMCRNGSWRCWLAGGFWPVCGLDINMRV